MGLGRVRKGLQVLFLLTLLFLLFLIFFPVPIGGGKDSGRKVACLSNIKQLSLATLLYTADHDDLFPVVKVQGRTTALGWAGRIRPELQRNRGSWIDSDLNWILRCPVNQEAEIGYAINANLAAISLASAHSDPQRSVLIFEVAGAQLSGADEFGRGERLSPIGDGTSKGLRDASDPASAPIARYATGTFSPGTDPAFVSPRHGDRSNFAFLDGHVRSTVAREVSPGANARDLADAEQATGGVRPDLPGVTLSRAAGTANRSRKFTFSVR